MFLNRLAGLKGKLIRRLKEDIQQEVREYVRVGLDELDNYRVSIKVKNVDIEIDIQPREDHPELRNAS